MTDDAQARKYHVWWSRFDQPDPFDGSYNLADPQSFNRYAYVQNDPVNFTDPSGLLMSSGGFCGAEYSFSDCGGWGGITGGYFGGDYADYQRNYGWLPSGAVEEYQRYEQRVSNAMGGNGFRTNAEIIRAQAMLCRSAGDCWDAGSWSSVDVNGGSQDSWYSMGFRAAHKLVSSLRGPDFIVANVAVGAGGIGVGTSRVTVRGDSLYDSLVNPMKGVSVGTGGEISFAFGWLLQLNQPNRDDIRSWLGGKSGQISAFDWVGGGFIRAPNSTPHYGVIVGIGVGGRGASGGYTK